MKLGPFGGLRLDDELDRNWVGWVCFAWLLVLGWLLWDRWNYIQWLVLSDTDDNMRLMQVRALLHGQGWYDLRQYRLYPPIGFDIHWSRLVDLPIAGLILALRPFLGNAEAERLACGIAPVLPLFVTFLAIGFTARRLVNRFAWPVALILVLGCATTMTMFAPMRIDHHGWQLACLSVTVAGLADPRRARAGALVGISSAASLTIGLEMLPYCAMAGAIIALRWIWDAAEAPRMQVYGLTLGGGTALGFAAFASYANQVMRCDALTPVYLTVMVSAGALLLLLGLANPRARWLRLLLAALAGGLLAGGFATLFPQCLGRPEQVSPELMRVWLDHVREARPIYVQPFRNAFPMAALPVIGLVGALLATWRARRSDALVGWAAVTLFTAFAGAMLAWQIRAAPAAQLLAVPGATALTFIIVPWFLKQRWAAVRVLGPVVAFLVVSGLFAGLLIQYLPIDRPSNRTRTVRLANARCTQVTSLRTLDRIPAAVMFTHVDLGPRLITITHHDAVAGPYHRNGQAILDVHHAFDGSPANFRTIAQRDHAAYLLICPNMAETTVYRARSPNGFYAQLARGRVPSWLEPVTLPKNSPYRLWKIRYDLPLDARRAAPARK